MKPPTKSDRPAATGGAGETQVIDLQDIELLVAEQAVQAEEAAHERSLPPPLPPEVRASHLPSEPPRISQAPSPSFYPQPPAPASRSTGFYVGALLAFFLVIGGGVFAVMTLRKAPAAPSVAATPSSKPQAAVITIPVVEVDDDPDSGK